MANHKRIQPEQEPEIQRLHAEGYAGSLIARRLGIPRDTLYKKLKEMGLEVDRHRRRSGLSQKEIQELCVAYQKGASTQELGERSGVSASAISTYLRAAGVEPRPAGFQHGSDHHAWSGGRYLDGNGYVKIWVSADDPFVCMAQKHGKSAGGYCYEHRLVMARQLGRPLEDHETVHHIDGNKQNNVLENLQLRQGKHGKGVVFCCADCGSHNITSSQVK